MAPFFRFFPCTFTVLSETDSSPFAAFSPFSHLLSFSLFFELCILTFLRFSSLDHSKCQTTVLVSRYSRICVKHTERSNFDHLFGTIIHLKMVNSLIGHNTIIIYEICMCAHSFQQPNVHQIYQTRPKNILIQAEGVLDCVMCYHLQCCCHRTDPPFWSSKMYECWMEREADCRFRFHRKIYNNYEDPETMGYMRTSKLWIKCLCFSTCLRHCIYKKAIRKVICLDYIWDIAWHEMLFRGRRRQKEEEKNGWLSLFFSALYLSPNPCILVPHFLCVCKLLSHAPWRTMSLYHRIARGGTGSSLIWVCVSRMS